LFDSPPKLIGFFRIEKHLSLKGEEI